MDKLLKINIVQWNAQSIYPKKLDFEQLLSKEKVHIAALCETWLDSLTNFTIRDYQVFRRDRLDTYGGVAILTHRTVKTQLCFSQQCNCRLVTRSGIEIVHVKILNCQYIENIISLYCPPAIHTSQSDWDTVFSIADSKTIFLGDFNGHHTNWSSKTDHRGKQIFDSLLDSNFITLNDGNPTRLKLVNGTLQRTSPDVSIVSCDISLKCNWRVTNESLGSDHLIIICSLAYHATPSFIKKRNYQKANWDQYKNYIQDRLANFDLPSHPQKAYDKFITSILI